ncbi:MAG: hypothetical protein ACR2KV_03530 [Solirubrobacteraceae bacterium]
MANRTAATVPLLAAVRERAAAGAAEFHLMMPATPQGLHRVVDPEDNGREEATARLAVALPLLSEAAGSTVTGEVGNHDPLGAVHDAVHSSHYDEIIISTLPKRMSRWLKLDLPSKLAGFGLPVTLVNPDRPATPAERVYASAAH